MHTAACARARGAAPALRLASRRRITLSLAALGVALAPGTLAAQERSGARPELAELRFEGVSTFDESALRSAIVSRESRCKYPILFFCAFGVAMDRYYLDDVTLSADEIRLRLFYYQRGYRETTVEADSVPLPQGLRIVFRVAEGRPVRVSALEVAGAAGILEAGHAPPLPLRVGRPFSLIAFEAARDSLTSVLWDAGYPRAQVLSSYFIPATAPREAQVRYEVIPGTPARFGEIEIAGTEHVDTAVVRRMLTFRSGDPYRRTELLRSQSNLFGLDVFSHASVQPRLDAEPDSIVPVLILVNEGDIHRVRVGAGINGADCVNAEGSWTSRNFAGGARRLQVRGRIANVLAEEFSRVVCPNAGSEIEVGPDIYDDLTGSLAADFTQPWFFGPRNTLGLGLFIERRSFPDVFVRNARGGYVTLTRSLGARTSLTLGYRPERTSLESENDLFFCINFVACDTSQIRTLSRPNWLAPATLAFVRDRANSPFAPTRGYTLRIEAEYAAHWTGSDFPYTRWTADLSGYRELGRGVVLATHLRSGWARAFEGEETIGLNPQKRFFAGGANSVRGFGQYRLGPKVLLVTDSILAAPDTTPPVTWDGCTATAIATGACDAQALATHRPGHFAPRPVGGAVLLEGNIELRFPLSPEKWRGAAFVDFGQVWQSEEAVRFDDVLVTPGFGVRYYSPIGPIRVDIGYNPQGPETRPVIARGMDGSTLHPLIRDVSWNPRSHFWDRLQFHFSIGQAF